MNPVKLLYKVSGRVFLILAVLIALVPFLDLRVLRMAGDEKVYISQSIEMARNHSWFVQTLADEPNYFKGPLHYVLTRAGMLAFGNHLAAGVWMNALFALLAGFAMYQLGRKRWDDKTGLLLGFAAALNVGVFSHALASQMEVEVFAFYTVALAALGLAHEKRDFKMDLLFWVSAGMAGWSKSPAHSVLIAAGGLLFWLWTGQIFSRVKSFPAWIAAGIGILVGIAGYAPAYFLDRTNFMSAYLLREQFEKANNNRSWDYVVKPLIYFMLPWTVFVIEGFMKAIRLKIKRIKPGPDFDSRMLKLGLAMAAPTILMWTTWTYKGQNYNLPALSALILAGLAPTSGKLSGRALKITGAIGALALIVTIALVTHFMPLPAWWSWCWIGIAFAGITIFMLSHVFSDDLRVIALGATAFFVAFGAFITPLGEREMIDIRKFIREHPGATYHYYNLDPSIWNEWGLIQLTVHQPVFGVHRESQLNDATRPGHVILVQNTDALNIVMSHWRAKPEKSRGPEPIVLPWTRWLTKGKTSEGRSRWKDAWVSRDLAYLEREFFIMWFPEKPVAQASPATQSSAASSQGS